MGVPNSGKVLCEAHQKMRDKGEDFSVAIVPLEEFAVSPDVPQADPVLNAADRGCEIDNDPRPAYNTVEASPSTAVSQLQDFIEECGVMLADAELECGHKHQKMFTWLSGRRGQCAVPASVEALPDVLARIDGLIAKWHSLEWSQAHYKDPRASEEICADELAIIRDELAKNG